jgi:hypothetical protein
MGFQLGTEQLGTEKCTLEQGPDDILYVTEAGRRLGPLRIV